jgi:hypothetical protein
MFDKSWKKIEVRSLGEPKGKVRQESISPICSRRDSLGWTYHNETEKAWHLNIFINDSIDKTDQQILKNKVLATPTADTPLEETFSLQEFGNKTLQVKYYFSEKPLSEELLKKIVTNSNRVDRQRLGASHFHFMEVLINIGS